MSLNPPKSLSRIHKCVWHSLGPVIFGVATKSPAHFEMWLTSPQGLLSVHVEEPEIPKVLQLKWQQNLEYRWVHLQQYDRNAAVVKGWGALLLSCWVTEWVCRGGGLSCWLQSRSVILISLLNCQLHEDEIKAPPEK